MKKILTIVIGASMLAFGAINLSPKKAEAWPGYGGTVTNKCTKFVPTANVVNAVSISDEGITASEEYSGGTFRRGTERSCSDKVAYCAWDASCQI